MAVDEADRSSPCSTGTASTVKRWQNAGQMAKQDLFAFETRGDILQSDDETAPAARVQTMNTGYDGVAGFPQAQGRMTRSSAAQRKVRSASLSVDVALLTTILLTLAPRNAGAAPFAYIPN